MFQNFLSVAVRHFMRQRLYSLINVVGLSAGLVCVMMIYLWVRDEVSKDRFHKDVDRIVHVVSNLDMGDGKIVTWNVTPGPLAEDIRENVPGVELVARTAGSNNPLFQYGDKNFTERGIFADPDFFKIFSFPIIKGSPAPIGDDKNSIAISQKMASRLFGSDDPIGKVIKVSKQYDVEVKAVFEDAGANSSMKFDFVMPFAITKESRGQGFNWGNYDYPVFIKMTDAGKMAEISNTIESRRTKLAKDGQLNGVTFYVQPFTDRYLHAQFENGVPVGGRIKYVQLFSVVAVFILLIACINFMNMATAKAGSRAKEVGVRKVVGAQRYSLIVQFITESVTISLLSMIVALAVVYTTLPMFNSLISKNITLDFTDAGFIASAVAIVLFTGILAGSYPAFFLSAYKPATVLKGNMAGTFTGSSLRKILVVFQFSLTVILGASALVIYKQIEFVRNKNIGYNRENVLTFSLRGAMADKYEAFRDEASKIPGVKLVSRADNSLVQVQNQNGSVTWPGKPDNSSIFFRTVCVDFDFLETMELKLVEGRLFSREFADTSNFVVTQHAVDVMGLKNPVGQRITQWGMEGTIVGVVEDFHSQSLQQSIDPIIFMCKTDWSYRAFVRVEGAKTTSVINDLTALIKRYTPEYSFEYTFLDQDFENLYNNEKVISSLAIIFTVMTIVISGLGLLGLAAYTAERRKKEVSIRKILGASIPGIVTMMSGEFVKLSFFAALIGCPLAYFLMSKYLEAYAYHDALGWEIFVITAACVMIMSVVTVMFQVARAALANPVNALRNE